MIKGNLLTGIPLQPKATQCFFHGATMGLQHWVAAVLQSCDAFTADDFPNYSLTLGKNIAR